MPQTLSRISAVGRSLLISAGLVAALSVTFGFYVVAEKQIERANELRLHSYLLANELRQSSDDLTRMVRSYVATGNPVYKQLFQQILDIRNGLRPKPDGHHPGDWDVVKEHPASLAAGAATPLKSRMEEAGFTREELKELQTAQTASDALTRLEFEAMRMAESAPPRDATARSKALDLLFGAEYLGGKREIMAQVDKAIGMMERRTTADVLGHEKRASVIRFVFIALGITLILMLWQSSRQIHRILGTSLAGIYSQVARIGQGDFSSIAENQDTARDSLMGRLLEAAGLLRKLEEDRQEGEASRQAMTRMFETSSEGIMISDTNGIILDVNDAFLVMSGYARDEIIGQTPRILRSDRHDESFHRNLWETLAREGQWRGEIWNRRKDGELYAGLLSISRIVSGNGKTVRYISLFTDITPLKIQQQQVEHIAYHDTLTGLPNRMLLSDRMEQALARARRSHESVAIVCLDLDGFKAVNDTLGHEAGDTLLIEVARRLSDCVRADDTVARLGGDEFVVLLYSVASLEACETTLYRILEELALPVTLSGHSASISGSIGYTMFPNDDADADTLLRHADQAMYVAKQAGKNRFHRFDLNQDTRTKANWSALSRIEKALNKGEFRLYIQPKVELQTGKVTGAEALIRWLHPVRGLIPPAEFLPLIEDRDISVAVGEWVIEEGLRLLQSWHAENLNIRLSVNVSARQLREPRFTARLDAALKQFPDLPLRSLEIEIVESAALNDMTKVSDLIGQCQNLGVDFALDDFGTGYSSLTYLRRLAVNTLKIDQTFVRDMLVDGNDFAIVRGVIGLAQAFGSHTVAEGVETWAHATILHGLGCDTIQGYILSKPMPHEEFPQWVQNFRMPDIQGPIK